MIFGIGVDIVKVSRFEDMIRRYPERFIRRVFTEDEVLSSKRRLRQSLYLSARFAAKEAFMKSIGTGWKEGVRWKEIEVVEGPMKRPTIRLSGRTRELFEMKGLKNAHLSISHDGDYSVAVVVIEV